MKPPPLLPRSFHSNSSFVTDHRSPMQPQNNSIDWTEVPKAFGHEKWAFGLIVGNGIAPSSFDLRAVSEGHVEKRRKDLKLGKDVVEVMTGEGSRKTAVDEVYERFMEEWERIGEVKMSRMSREQKKNSETLYINRGVQKWQWQFPAGDPPDAIKALYKIVKDFFAPWLLGDGALEGAGKRPSNYQPIVMAAPVSYVKSDPTSLLDAAKQVNEAIAELTYTLDEVDIDGDD
eukprot:TRINITY_DN2692_c0_g1_i1.p1 TRINITY_DN2692_c0_g1~~TRINITY_DN2692_c0_g1_i1.p1  ORF type:complete len:231 (+),score=61.71 TRINITY_DN2692_c0_g1_i1:74-766(+)